MGTACWNLERYAEAASFAEKALRLDPLLKEAKFNLAISLLLMGRGGEGKSLLERLIDEQPDYTAAQFMLCVAHMLHAGESAGGKAIQKAPVIADRRIHRRIFPGHIEAFYICLPHR